MSGFINSDIQALKVVHEPSIHITTSYLERNENKEKSEFLKKIYIRRLPPFDHETLSSKDVSPIFVMHEEGYEMTFVFFYYEGSWKFLFNNRRGDGLWQTNVKKVLQEKLDSIKNK